MNRLAFESKLSVLLYSEIEGISWDKKIRIAQELIESLDRKQKVKQTSEHIRGTQWSEEDLSLVLGSEA